MNATSPQRIVVGVDGSTASRLALERAVDEARLRNARLGVVHAWYPPYVGGFPYTAVPSFDLELREQTAATVLDQAIGAVDTSGLAQPVERIVSQGGASAVILEASKGADLVVLGSSGLGGFASLLLGSGSHQVVQHAVVMTGRLEEITDYDTSAWQRALDLPVDPWAAGTKSHWMRLIPTRITGREVSGD